MGQWLEPTSNQNAKGSIVDALNAPGKPDFSPAEELFSRVSAPYGVTGDPGRDVTK